jgi:LuxR family transcriptional regulator, quorum-sensing system regulator BjaR1
VAMQNAKDIYAKRTLDFIERIQLMRSYDEICAHILKEMEWFGFSCVTSFSVPGAGQTLKDCLWMNNRRQDYIDRYSEKTTSFMIPLLPNFVEPSIHIPGATSAPSGS